jgi:hypothetical protein
LSLSGNLQISFLITYCKYINRDLLHKPSSACTLYFFKFSNLVFPNFTPGPFQMLSNKNLINIKLSQIF